MYAPCKDRSEGRGAALIYIVINAFFKRATALILHMKVSVLILTCTQLMSLSGLKINLDATMLLSVVRHLERNI